MVTLIAVFGDNHEIAHRSPYSRPKIKYTVKYCDIYYNKRFWVLRCDVMSMISLQITIKDSVVTNSHRLMLKSVPLHIIRNCSWSFLRLYFSGQHEVSKEMRKVV